MTYETEQYTSTQDNGNVVNAAPQGVMSVNEFEPHSVRFDEFGLPEITLSDGRVAKYFRKPKARDAALANDQQRNQENDVRRAADFMSRLVLIDGRKVNPDQVLELDMPDFNAIALNMPGKM